MAKRIHKWIRKISVLGDGTGDGTAKWETETEPETAIFDFWEPETEPETAIFFLGETETETEPPNSGFFKTLQPGSISKF